MDSWIDRWKLKSGSVGVREDQHDNKIMKNEKSIQAKMDENKTSKWWRARVSRGLMIRKENKGKREEQGAEGVFVNDQGGNSLDSKMRWWSQHDEGDGGPEDQRIEVRYKVRLSRCQVDWLPSSDSRHTRRKRRRPEGRKVRKSTVNLRVVKTWYVHWVEWRIGC